MVREEKAELWFLTYLQNSKWLSYRRAPHPYISSGTGESNHITPGYLPTEDHDRQKLASRKLDKEVCDHRLPDKLRDIHNSTQPAVLVADQICVFDETEYGGIAQGCFVK